MYYKYTVSFFGHRYVDDFKLADERVKKIIYRLLSEKEYVEFLVGRDGEFDQVVSSAIRSIKKTYRDDNCSHTWIMPYVKAEYLKNADEFDNYYDNVESFSNLKGDTHFKAAFSARNRYMIDCSDLIVFYVKRNSGGAYTALRYAKRNKKKFINISEPEFDF